VFAAGAVWALGADGKLLRVDPQTLAVTERLPLDVAPRRPGTTLVAAGDTIWLSIGDVVVEVDARARRVVGEAPAPLLPAEIARRIAADADGLWVSSPTRREVLHIAARTRQITRIPVAGDPGPLALVDGRVWIGTVHDSGHLTRVTVLDATDGRALATLPVPYPAVNIFPSPAGGAWVTFGEDATQRPAALHVSGP
jgi:hypothetical protein